MEIYTEIQTFKISKVQKETLQKLKANKINISKFIRDAVKEKIEREKLVKKDNRRKYTIDDFKESLNLFAQLKIN